MNDTTAPQPFAFGDTATMTPEAARAEHGRAITDPVFGRMLNGGGAASREQAMGYLEALGKAQAGQQASRQFGTPGVTAQDLKADPAYQADASGKNGPEGVVNARSQLDSAERMEAASQVTLSDQEAAQLERLNTPTGANSYLEVTGLGFDSGEVGQQARQILFDHGISPVAVKQLADAVPRADAMTDDAYLGAVDRARDHVMRMPGGKQIIENALTFLNALPDAHPLARIAVAACADPRGIIEMARLYGAGKGLRRAS
jgi:hypothetical protein